MNIAIDRISVAMFVCCIISLSIGLLIGLNAKECDAFEYQNDCPEFKEVFDPSNCEVCEELNFDNCVNVTEKVYAQYETLSSNWRQRR